MTVKFFPNDRSNPPGKLADAELHFKGGPLDGLKLVGFAVWERKNGGRNVTFPARQYSVNGERRSFALLRPISDGTAQDKLRDAILDAGLFLAVILALRAPRLDREAAFSLGGPRQGKARWSAARSASPIGWLPSRGSASSAPRKISTSSEGAISWLSGGQ